MYIADTFNSRVRKITTSTGIITTFAGTGTAGYGDNNVAATSAALYSPAGVALDSAGISVILIAYYSLISVTTHSFCR